MAGSALDRFDRRKRSSEFTSKDAIAASRIVKPGHLPDSATLLEGGFSNANFCIRSGAHDWVIRFYSDGIGTAMREVAILQLAKSRGVHVPAVLADPIEIDGKAAAALEFVPGANVATEAGSFFEIGRQLGFVQRITFPQAGWIGPQGEVTVPFENLAATANQYILRPLEGRAGKRLGESSTRKLRQLVERRWHHVEETDSGPVLSHCDFNPKNMIAGPGPEQICVLDWEFAIAGHPLQDVGNFLRFADEDYTPQMRQNFLAGYQAIRGPLPPNWEMASKLLDLVSLCTFLDSEEERPKTFQTAAVLIAQLLETHAIL